MVSTLLLNEGIPRALEGKKLRLKIPRVLHSIFEIFLVFQIWGQNTIGGQYLQKINALIFWYKYLQKVNAMPSDFWWKKTSFAPLMNIFLIHFLKDQKLFVKEANLFFHQKSEGILHLLFAGNTLKFERLKIFSEIKGNFKLDGNVLKIALKLYSALRFERLKWINLFKNQGQ